MADLENIRQEITRNGKRGLFIATGLKIDEFKQLAGYFRDTPMIYVTKLNDSTLAVECKNRDAEEWVSRLTKEKAIRVDGKFIPDVIIDYEYFFKHIKDAFLAIGILILDFEILDSEIKNFNGDTIGIKGDTSSPQSGHNTIKIIVENSDGAMTAVLSSIQLPTSGGSLDELTEIKRKFDATLALAKDPSDETERFGDFSFNSYQSFYKDEPLNLAPQPKKLLIAFLRSPDGRLNVHQIVSALWGEYSEKKAKLVFKKTSKLNGKIKNCGYWIGKDKDHSYEITTYKLSRK